MLKPELLSRVKQIEFQTKKWVNDALTGSFKSQFKGQGVAFSEHRPYVAGDDVRHIDWRVSARTRDPLIRKYEEERELVVMLLVDLSASSEFASQGASKREVIAELSALVAAAAGKTGERVGCIVFDGKVRAVQPPRKGRTQALKIIGEVLSFEPESGGTDLEAALAAAQRVMKQRGVVFLFSDLQIEEIGEPLRRLSSRHDLICVRVQDSGEWHGRLPPHGEIWIEDPETGSTQCVDLGSSAWRQWLMRHEMRLKERWQAELTRARVDSVEIESRADYVGLLVRFLKARARSKRTSAGVLHVQA